MYMPEPECIIDDRAMVLWFGVSGYWLYITYYLETFIWYFVEALQLTFYHTIGKSPIARNHFTTSKSPQTLPVHLDNFKDTDQIIHLLLAAPTSLN